jgi:hypothetical protein
MDAILVAVLVALLTGCGGAPAKFRDYRDRNGDFVNNIASAAQERPTAPASTITPVARASGQGVA